MSSSNDKGSSQQNESFVDTRNWSFKARSQQIDLFSEDLDRTSATDFFNRTNGLGSPEFYAQKRLKEQEDKENALRGRPLTRRLQQAQKLDVKPKVTVKPKIDLHEQQKANEEFRKRFSALTTGPVVVPERDDAVKRRESRSGLVPQVKTSITGPTAVPKRTDVVSRRVSRSGSVTRTNAPVAKPPVVNKPMVVKVPVTKPIIRPAVTKSAVKNPIIKSAITKPSVSKLPITSKPVAGQPREPVMTRSKEAARRRFSFMEPTEASRRRSICFLK